MKNNDNIHSSHRKRLRNRYAREGIDNFEDHEILELLLQYPIRNGDTNETAHNLINEIGSFGGVFDAEIAETTAVKGIGESSAVFLKLVRDMFDYYMVEKNEKGSRFRTVTSAARYCVEQYRNIVEETYSVMLFDMSDRLLGFEALPNCSFHDPNSIRMAVGRLVFAYNANFFILVRNATDGSIVPSDKEIRTYLDLKECFSAFNRKLFEYFIIHRNRYMPVGKYYIDRYDQYEGEVVEESEY